MMEQCHNCKGFFPDEALMEVEATAKGKDGNPLESKIAYLCANCVQVLIATAKNIGLEVQQTDN